MDASTTIAPPAAGHRSSSAEGLEGAALIRAHLLTLPNAPGVYRMVGAKGDVLYVGKAKSLKKRVVTYTKPQALPSRLQRMVALTRSMEFVQTRSEVEALLLEANLIKRYRPSFNILLRDDKSFPFIALRHGHPFPMLARHRGQKVAGAEYFGPFASSGAVHETMNALLRAFPLRSCTDAVFEARTRPCLQHQIKRCSAPCVGRIDEGAYGELVREVRGFLGGRTREVQERLQGEMRAASERLDFEQAAALRDRLKAIAHISSRQGINTDAVDDADVIALHEEAGEACVQVFFYRSGRNYGNRAHYPANVGDAGEGEVLAAFIAQFYAERPAPGQVLLSHAVPEDGLLAEALAVRAGRRVELLVPRRGPKCELVAIAKGNAEAALARKRAEQGAQRRLVEGLAERFGLEKVPERIEVYDNSHIQGAHAVGSFVVAGPDGFERRAYRTFNIKEATPGDDYAMMGEVLGRRFRRLAKEDHDAGARPDLVLIDGGAGQLAAAKAVLDGLGVEGVELLGVAKGPERDKGEERFFRPDREPVMLAPRDPVLYFIQRLRDEAHRFAIETHRGKRRRAIGTSKLDAIPGIGGKRKKALLGHFGSARGVQGASLADLEQVPGVSKAVARAIHDHFHEGG
ncbi:MAG: excinuclease ABC subunit UvrC [Geminicoccaceae bacterium]|nr:excinuclease ABC subunit UvrC [Geminicoccaceae bacterium]